MMNPTIGIILLVAGVWLITSTFMLSAKGLFYIFYFKILPFFIGMTCLWAGAKWFSWI